MSMDMEKAWEATQKITSAFAEDKYTDKEGLVWLGIEGDTRDEDCWLREDALVSMSSADMMKKMINELMHWDETPVEDPYEYAIKRTSLTGNSEFILGDLWGDRAERETALKSLKEDNAANFVKYWLVKRRKAGRIEDV